jgi:RNA-binding protein
MSTLSQTERKMLKQAAHHLKPVILTGGKGLTEAVHKEITRALFDHELIKIKINAEEREDRKAMIEEIAAQHEAEVIQQVGHTATFYKKKEA